MKAWDLLQPTFGLAVAPACMAHKSSEICEPCRLRQPNPPAMPDNSAAFLESRN